jgi:hypothetical protein
MDKIKAEILFLIAIQNALSFSNGKYGKGGLPNIAYMDRIIELLNKLKQDD